MGRRRTLGYVENEWTCPNCRDCPCPKNVPVARTSVRNAGARTKASAKTPQKRRKKTHAELDSMKCPKVDRRGGLVLNPTPPRPGDRA